MAAVPELVMGLRGLLDRYCLEEPRPLPPGMPGLVNPREERLALNRGSKIWQHTLHAMVCGGVSMNTQMNRASVRPRRKRYLQRKCQAIIRDRPHVNMLRWPL